MNRLLVNPGTPQAWEIQLKPGTNRIGRGDAVDFQINHPSVSTSHCEITVGEGGAFFRDLGSTNGSFINEARVTEAGLEHGQRIQLGGIAMMFEGAAVAPEIATSPPQAGTMHVSLPPPPRMGGLRISAPAESEPGSEPVAGEIEEESSDPPPMAVPAMNAPNAFCKSHIKSPARFYCPKCRVFFCDICVATRNTTGVAMKFCRTCGSNCTPVKVKRAGGAKTKGFFAKLPGAFGYPFRGAGFLVLIVATLLFAALDMMSGIFAILLTLAAIGYLFLFMQNIIHVTAMDENETLSLASPDELFAACFRLIGTVTVSFGLPIGMAIAKFFEVDIPWIAIMVTGALGCLYFPMAFLAVAMKDNIMAINPMVVIPSILKIPLEYIVASVLFLGIFAIRFMGGALAGAAENVTFATKDMNVLFMALGFRALWSFISVYLLTVSMRIMGLLYVTKKEKLGWF